MDEYLPTLPPRRRLWIIIAAFAALALLVYGKSLGNDFVRWDDGMLITDNLAVRSMSGPSIKWIFTHFDPELYIPLTFLSFQVDYLVGGGSALPFHIGNLVLHTINALLVAWLLYLLTRRGKLSIFFAALFLIHPLNTEAVAWASARKDVLSGFFFLSALVGYLYYRERGGSGLYLLCVSAFFLGLLAKVSVITLPIVCLLIDWKDGRPLVTREQVREKAPFLLLALLFGVVALLGKRDVLAETSFFQKCLLAVKSSVFYWEKMLWPSHLSVLYPYLGQVTIASPDFFLPLLLLLAVAALTIVSLRRSRTVAFAVLFYFITLAPTFTNLAKAGDIYIASDRYVYLSFIAVLYLLVFACAEIARWIRASWVPLCAAGIGVLVLFALGVKAYAQSGVWKNTDALFSSVLSTYKSYRALNNYANALRREGRLDEAIAKFHESLAIHPHALTYSNLGATYHKNGMNAEAQKAYDDALKLDPRSAEAYVGIGLLDADTGDAQGAQKAYGQAIALRPDYTDAYVDRASLYLDSSNIDGALPDAKKAVSLDPYLPEAHFNLALAYQGAQRFDEAIPEYERAVALAPSFIPARLNLGVLEYQKGDRDQAVATFEEVLRISPTNKAALSALAQIQAAGR